MGLSIAVSGIIILTSIMLVLMSIPGLLDIIFSVGDVSSEVFELEESILQTNVFIDSLSATSGLPSLTFNLNNVGNEKLWNYDEFDLFVTYDADISGTKTRVTEILPFGVASLGPGFSILAEVVSTTPDTTASGSYTVINDMTATVNVAGPSSHILFHANITYDSDGADASCRTALFIDGSMVAEAEDTVDHNTVEPGNVGLTWWETGLSAGSHTFDVRWLEEQTDCIIATDTERSMQVLEFTASGVPTILTEVTSSTAQSYSGIYSLVAGMTGSPTIAGPDSLVFTTGTVSFDEDGTGDASCFLGIFIDSTLQAEQQTYTDRLDEGTSAGVMWAETALSAGSHTFELQAREGQTGCGTDTDLQRHMQVTEFPSAGGNPIILSEITSTALQDMTAIYTVITGLTDTVTITGRGSVVLFTSTITFDASSADAEGDAALFIDGINVAEGRTFIDSGSNEPGHVNLHWWATDLSAGPHTFDVRGRDGSQAGAETDTASQRHMQIVEFPCGKWNIVSISNDLLDPGMLNMGETAQISLTLCNPIFANGELRVVISSDNGVITSNAITVT